MDLRFIDCLFEVDSGVMDAQSTRLVYHRTHFLATSAGFEIYAGDVTYNYFSIRKLGARSGTAMDFKQFSDSVIQSMYVENFTTGLAFTSGLWMLNQSGHDIIIENVERAINVRNRTHLIATKSEIWIDDANYTYSATETLDFGTKVLVQNFNGTPSLDTFHSSVTVTGTDVSKDIYWTI